MDTPANNWGQVEADVSAIIQARSSEYGAAIRANLSDLLNLLRSTGRPVPWVDPGYWPTFRIAWDKRLEIEIFDDRYEVYRFYDGRTDIWYEEHVPGQLMSEAFLRELPEPLS